MWNYCTWIKIILKKTISFLILGYSLCTFGSTFGIVVFTFVSKLESFLFSWGITFISIRLWLFGYCYFLIRSYFMPIAPPLSHSSQEQEEELLYLLLYGDCNICLFYLPNSLLKLFLWVSFLFVRTRVSKLFLNLFSVFKFKVRNCPYYNKVLHNKVYHALCEFHPTWDFSEQVPEQVLLLEHFKNNTIGSTDRVRQPEPQQYLLQLSTNVYKGWMWISLLHLGV